MASVLASARNRRAYILPVALAAAALLLDLRFYASTLEDAFITFRYSKHLAEGYGLGAWNTVGARAEGYTPFLWMLLLALAHRFGVNLLTAAKILGIVGHLGIVVFLFSLDRVFARDLADDHLLRRNDGAVGKLAGALAALYLPLAWYATSGMEATVFALFATVAVVLCAVPGRRAQRCLIAVVVVLILLRPEGLAVAFATQAFALLEARRRGQDVRLVLLGIGISLVTLAGLTGLRLAVYGDWLPNTYYAKAGGAGGMHLRLGVRYMLSYLLAHQVIWVLIGGLGAAVLRTRRDPEARWVIFLIGLAGVYMLYVLKVGGDNPAAFSGWRQMVHLFGPIALLCGIALETVLVPQRRLGAWVLAGTLLLTNLAVARTEVYGLDGILSLPVSIRHQRPNPYYLWLKDLAAPGDTIASTWGGELPFTVDAVFIDMLGLNDRHIARSGTFDPDGPVDSKTDMDYVLQQRPDVIEGYLPGNGLRDGQSRDALLKARRRMLNEMLQNPIFRDEYVFVLNGPYDSMDRALFLRRDYWQNHPRRASLQCVPVRETSLYRGPQEPGAEAGKP